jgi:hypothetical protein
MKATLTELLTLARTGDEMARWQVRQHLIVAMSQAAAANAHVRRQMSRLGLRWVGPKELRPEKLLDLLACTDLGARLVERIGDIGWQPVDKVVQLVEQGLPVEETVERVARWTLLHILDEVDSLVLVRKAIERGVRLAARAGEIEEIIAVGFRKSDHVESHVKAAVEHRDKKTRKPDPLIGPPIRIQRLRETVVVFTSMAATWQKGERLDIVFRRPFIGPPGAVSDLVRNSLDPWRELNQLRKKKNEVLEFARNKIKPLVPKRRKGRGTVRQIVAIPGDEVKRIARELAQEIGHPVERAIFFSGLYATLSECGFETLAREKDPVSPFAKQREESPEMDIIRKIDDERSGNSPGRSENNRGGMRGR